MTSRTRYEVLPTRKADLKADPALLPWTVTRAGERLSTHETKREAVELATTTARCAWRTSGQLGQVRIKGRNGKIQDERTYGADPTDTKG